MSLALPGKTEPRVADICLVLTGKTIEEDIYQIDRYRSYIDLVELRVDLLSAGERSSISEFADRCDLPVICTIRRESDGGGFAGTEEEREELFGSAVGAGFAFVDLEIDFAASALRDAFVATGTEVIRSFHDFEGVPDNLQAVFRELSANSAEIPKLAVYPRCFADAARLFTAARAWEAQRKIVLGMGSYGFFTRVLAAKLGSMLTFSSVEDVAAAPGHVDPKTLCDVYRFKHIHRDTRVLGVIGNPVMHSKSPWIHNPAIDRSHLDMVYVPFHVDNPELFLDTFRSMDIDGFSVTVPHKERLGGRLDSSDEIVSVIGSCNTVVVSADGSLHGRNTDVPGFLAAADHLFAPGPLPSRAVVVGAGGTARTVVYALRSRGIEVLVVNRTPERAQRLARELDCAWGPLSAQSIEKIRSYRQFIVQTTSAGMVPNIDTDPLEFYPFSGDETLFDVVYTPEVTKLMRRAQTAGCAVTNGSLMLLEQAYLQFEAFTGVVPAELTGDSTRA